MKRGGFTPSRGEIAAVLILLAVCAALIFAASPGGEGGYALIKRDGVEVARLWLYENAVFELPGNCVEVNGGRVFMKSADCPDQLCVKQGAAMGGGAIVCLPNRVTITIQGGDLDAVTR